MTSIELLVGAVMLIGLAGLIVPVVPGLPLILAAALVWVLADGTDTGQWMVFGVIAIVTTVGMVASSVIPARRAAVAGAPWWVLGVGAVGAVVGFFVIPVIGALVGAPLGIFAGEYVRQREMRAAWATTRATIRGIGLGIVIQFVAGVVAVGVWGVAALIW